MRPRNHSSRSPFPSLPTRARAVFRRAGLIALGALAALLFLPQLGPAEDESATVRSASPASAAEQEASAQNVLQPGYVMVLASWICPFPRLDEVNDVALRLIEPPLTELTEQGDLIGWGQFNGGFRDEYNYHTYYIAESMEDYRRAIGRVLTFMSQEVPDDTNAFYELCSRTRETRVTVVTARP